MTFCQGDSVREHDLGNLTRKFAYDGLNHHTLLATRHDGRVRRKSVGRKRASGEGGGGGNGCSDDGTWCSKITFSRPPQAQSTRQRQPESGLLRFRLLPRWRSVSPAPSRAYPRPLTIEFIKFRPSPPPTHRPPPRSRLLHSSKI
jgi:hypothetical protein